jgi:hypothetical protein
MSADLPPLPPDATPDDVGHPPPQLTPEQWASIEEETRKIGQLKAPEGFPDSTGAPLEPPYTAEDWAEFDALAAAYRDWAERCQAARHARSAAALFGLRTEYVRLSERRLQLRHRTGYWGLYNPVPEDPACALHRAYLHALDELEMLPRVRITGVRLSSRFADSWRLSEDL